MLDSLLLSDCFRNSSERILAYTSGTDKETDGNDIVVSEDDIDEVVDEVTAHTRM